LYSKKSSAMGARSVQETSFLFQVSCILNAGWIFAWQFLHIELSVIVMLVFLSLLIRVYLKNQPFKNELKTAHYIWLYLPFVVYLGWISVATIANITALLIHREWNGFGLDAVTWTYIMIGVATFLGLIFSLVRREWSYTLVIIWALYGIYVAQKSKPEVNNVITLIAMAVLLASFLFLYLGKIRPRSR
jgi:benzodiazapine receptor